MILFPSIHSKAWAFCYMYDFMTLQVSFGFVHLSAIRFPDLVAAHVLSPHHFILFVNVDILASSAVSSDPTLQMSIQLVCQKSQRVKFIFHSNCIFIKFFHLTVRPTYQSLHFFFLLSIHIFPLPHPADGPPQPTQLKEEEAAMDARDEVARRPGAPLSAAHFHVMNPQRQRLGSDDGRQNPQWPWLTRRIHNDCSVLRDTRGFVSRDEGRRQTTTTSIAVSSPDDDGVVAYLWVRQEIEEVVQEHGGRWERGVGHTLGQWRRLATFGHSNKESIVQLSFFSMLIKFQFGESNSHSIRDDLSLNLSLHLPYSDNNLFCIELQ